MSPITLEVRSTRSDCWPAPSAIFSIELATSSVEAFTSSAEFCSSLALSDTDWAVRWMRETRSRRFSCMVRMDSVRSSISSAGTSAALGDHRPGEVAAADLHRAGLEAGEPGDAADAQGEPPAQRQRGGEHDGAAQPRVRDPAVHERDGHEQHHPDDQVAAQDLGLERDLEPGGRRRRTERRFGGAAAQGDQVRRIAGPRAGPRRQPVIGSVSSHRFLALGRTAPTGPRPGS